MPDANFSLPSPEGLAAFTHCTIPDANFSSPTPRDLAAFT
jgi:hypothetical protein